MPPRGCRRSDCRLQGGPRGREGAAEILIDKADKFEYRQCVEATQINLLVSTYGDRSRDEILAELGMGSEPVETSPVPLSPKTVGT